MLARVRAQLKRVACCPLLGLKTGRWSLRSQPYLDRADVAAATVAVSSARSMPGLS